MHVALANRWYPPHTGFGGVAMYNYYLAHALVELGHRVTVLAARRSADVPQVADDRGVRVYRVLAQPWRVLPRLPLARRYGRVLRQAFYSAQVARALRLIESIERPDVVEFAEIEGEGFVYLARRQRLPTIVRCHTPSFVLRRYYMAHETPFHEPFTAAMERSCIQRADALTAPSHNMARTIAQSCDVAAEAFAVFPNPLDIQAFVADRPRRALDDDVTILHVGRLERVKGVELLVRAIPAILREVPRARFVFAGDDRPDGHGLTWQRRLDALVREQGSVDRVAFLGAIAQHDLLGWYRRADIVVVPSLLYESFSYTCAQAMAAGLPVIASSIGGIPETVGDGVSGLLVEPGNVGQLADAVVSLASNAHLRARMGLAGREKALREFSSIAVAQQSVDVYEQAKRQGEDDKSTAQFAHKRRPSPRPALSRVPAPGVSPIDSEKSEYQQDQCIAQPGKLTRGPDDA